MTDVRATAVTAARFAETDTRVERRTPHRIGAWFAGGLAVGNALLIVWLWAHGGNVTHVHSTGDLLTSIARLTGLLGAYLALVQVLLLARIPWVERAVGFDRLTVWHRWNGHACLDLVLAHVIFSVWGYALLDRLPLTREISTMIAGGIYLTMLALLVGFRVVVPVANAFRFRMRVVEVIDEGAGAISLRIDGRQLDRLHAKAGQFFLWRFLTRDRWWASHPFSLSAAPDGRSLSITIKNLGDFIFGEELRELAGQKGVVVHNPNRSTPCNEHSEQPSERRQWRYPRPTPSPQFRRARVWQPHPRRRSSPARSPARPWRPIAGARWR